MKAPIHEIKVPAFGLSFRNIVIAVLTGIASALNPETVSAYTWSGNGSDSSVNTAGNWVDGAAPPNSYSNYIFTGSTNTDVTLPAGTKNLSALTFDENAASFTIRGEVDTMTGYRFGFGRSNLADAVKDSIIQNSANDQTVLATFYISNGHSNVTVSGTGAGLLRLASMRIGLQTSNTVVFNMERDLTIDAFTLLSSGTLQLNISAEKTTTINAIAGADLETAGDFAVRKYGEGTMLLTGFNKSSGLTVIEAGRLLLGENAVYGGGASTASLTIKTGAILAGSGTVDVATLVIEDGASLAAGSYSASGTLTLMAGTRAFGQNLHVGGKGVLNAGASLNAQSLTVDDGAALILTNALTLAAGGTLAGSGTLTSSAGLIMGVNAGDFVQAAITDGSMLTLAATVSGPATVNITSGTLLAANGFGAGGISIASGAAFGGAGTVSGEVAAEGGAGITAGASGAGVAETLLLQGGLKLGNTAGDIIQADIATNKTLHVAVPLAGPGKLQKSGVGTLRLEGNNAGYTHDLTVGGGSVIVDDGIGSSFIDVASGAAFGGAGVVSGSLALGTGAILIVGAPGATADGPAGRVLAFNGDFSFGSGGTLAFDLLKKGGLDTGISTSLLLGAGQNFSGSADTYTINLGNLFTGVYNLGNIGYLADSGSAAIKVGGNELSGRQNAWLEKDASGNLILHTDAGSSMKLRWTGVSASWNTQDAEWTVTSGSMAFGAGDMVYFDSVTDAGREASRDIAIVGASMITSGMEVSGTGDYRFSGAAIVTDKDAASEELEAEATGKLVKKGGGVLTLANTGVNNFKGGVALEGGVLELASAGALGAGNLTITGSDTVLRFNSAGVATTGTLAIGSHALTIETILDGTLGGVITGTSALQKTGTATLTFAAAHAGAIAINEGTLRVGLGNTLANNAVTIAAGATLDLQLQDDTLRIFSGDGNIKIGNTALTLDNAEEIIFAGSFSGSGNIIKVGNGDLILSGSNRHEGGTRVSAGRLVVSNLDALGSGIATVDAAPDVVLEFRQVVGMRGIAIIGGGAVDVIGSQLAFSGDNIISRLRLDGSSLLTAASAGALGGAGADIAIGGGSALRVANRSINPAAILANNITINEGGTLLFASGTAPGKLELAGTLDFQTGAKVGFDGPIASGIYTLATTSGIPNAPEYLPSQHGMDVTFATNDNTLSVLAMNQSANPSKDAALTFDAMIATMTAVYNRISESFLLPVTERQAGRVLNDLWFKGIASRADYETTPGQIGHSDETYGIVAGYDGLVNERYLLGFYAGATDSKLDTANKGHADAQHQFGGVYGAFRLGCFYAGIDGSAGWVQADSRRVEADGEARGSYDAEYWGASAEIGFIINTWKNAVFKPGFGVHGMSIKMKNFKEHGPGALRVGAFNEHVLQSLLNLQVAQKFRMLGRASMLDVMIGWRQTLHDSNPDVIASFAASPENSVVLANPGYARGSFVTGLGIRTSISRHGVLGLGYDYEVASARARHTLSLTMRWLW